MCIEKLMCVEKWIDDINEVLSLIATSAIESFLSSEQNTAVIVRQKEEWRKSA